MTELTLTAFLAARYDEAEAAARAAEPWWPSTFTQPFATEPRAVHIARHDPARVLADIAAKRAIIQAWILRDQQGSGTGEGAATIASHAVGVLVALKHLAAVHAEHPDYRQEWAP